MIRVRVTYVSSEMKINSMIGNSEHTFTKVENYKDIQEFGDKVTPKIQESMKDANVTHIYSRDEPFYLSERVYVDKNNSKCFSRKIWYVEIEKGRQGNGKDGHKPAEQKKEKPAGK